MQDDFKLPDKLYTLDKEVFAKAFNSLSNWIKSVKNKIADLLDKDILVNITFVRNNSNKFINSIKKRDFYKDKNIFIQVPQNIAQGLLAFTLMIIKDGLPTINAYNDALDELIFDLSMANMKNDQESLDYLQRTIDNFTNLHYLPLITKIDTYTIVTRRSNEPLGNMFNDYSEVESWLRLLNKQPEELSKDTLATIKDKLENAAVILAEYQNNDNNVDDMLIRRASDLSYQLAANADIVVTVFGHYLSILQSAVSLIEQKDFYS